MLCAEGGSVRMEQEIIELGKKIHSLRINMRINQEELAFRADLNRNYISEIEAGKRNFSIRVLFRLAKALKVNVKDLF